MLLNISYKDIMKNVTSVLLRNADLYTPKHAGYMDILILGGKIAAIGQKLDVNIPNLMTIDLEGLVTAPGIIDHHNHFNGAGGEGGYNFRTPPAQLSTFIKAGVTSTIGLLGTDGYSRSLEELLQKARALEIEGISTWIYTGSYQVPGPTITGTVSKDIMLLDKVIGCKMALSDHRSSHPSVEMIRSLVSEVRVAGMLAGKRGVVCVHMGSEAEGLNPLRAALKNTDIPLTQFMPTHISRCEALITDSIAWIKAGGIADLTAGEDTPATLDKFLANEVNLDNVCFSSDGNGSMPKFNPAGDFIGVSVGETSTILQVIAACAKEKVTSLENLFACASTNPATWLSLPNKGKIEVGYDGDIIMLTKDLKLCSLMAKGRMMMRKGEILVKGTFE